MTDNEIIKALECCSEPVGINCVNCPLEKICLDVNTCEIALDLINRQKAEIERLKTEKDNLIRTYAECQAEAVKEFAEKSQKAIFIKQEEGRRQMLEILKTYRGTKAYSDTENATDNWIRGYGEAVQEILSINDNLLKETVGDTE